MKKILSVLCALAFIASFACIGASADAAVTVPTFDLVAAPVVEGDTTLAVDLVVSLPADATGYEIGSFGLDMSYDKTVMLLSEEPSWEVKGTSMNSEKVDDVPYMFLWASVKPKEQYPAGSTIAATMIFNLAAPAVAGTEYKIDLAINAKNPIMSMASQDGAYAENTYTADQVAVIGETAVATVPTVATTTAPITEPIVTTVEPIVTDPIATDAPVVTDAPATDAPATDAPATDAPATDAPATDAPATDAPVTTTEATTTTTATTKAPNKATQTGDMMFVVAAVMVVALGAAVVVKKVNVK